MNLHFFSSPPSPHDIGKLLQVGWTCMSSHPLHSCKLSKIVFTVIDPFWPMTLSIQYKQTDLLLRRILQHQRFREINYRRVYTNLHKCFLCWTSIDVSRCRRVFGHPLYWSTQIKQRARCGYSQGCNKVGICLDKSHEFLHDWWVLILIKYRLWSRVLEATCL